MEHEQKVASSFMKNETFNSYNSSYKDNFKNL